MKIMLIFIHPFSLKLMILMKPNLPLLKHHPLSLNNYKQLIKIMEFQMKMLIKKMLPLHMLHQKIILQKILLQTMLLLKMMKILKYQTMKLMKKIYPLQLMIFLTHKLTISSMLWPQYLLMIHLHLSLAGMIVKIMNQKKKIK
jgi:hypothetical protein